MRDDVTSMCATLAAAATILAATAARADAPPDQPAAQAPAPAPADDIDCRPPRPPLPPEPKRTSLPWERHLEIGGGAAFIFRPVSSDGDGRATSVRLAPGAGYNVYLNWEIFRYLRFAATVVGANHGLTLPPGSLGISGKADITSPSVRTYVFGARFSPTLPLGRRVRLWATVGAGWGRMEYGRITVIVPGRDPFTIPERSASIVEIPLGIGTSFEIIPRWLALQLELTGAFVPGQTGDALDQGQTIDSEGKKRHIGAMPRVDASIVQTIGLSLLL